MKKIIITKEEQKAIKSLERLAKRWPQSLSLFSWSGSLCVVKDGVSFGAEIDILNDGGDPDEEEILQELLHAEIVYE